MFYRELVTYQKLLTSAYCDQIATGKNKQSDKLVKHRDNSAVLTIMCFVSVRKGEASMKHLRMEIAKKCAEKIQVVSIQIYNIAVFASQRSSFIHSSQLYHLFYNTKLANQCCYKKME